MLSYSLELASYLYVSSHVQLTQQLNVQLPEDDIRPKLNMKEGAVCFGLIVPNICFSF